MEQLGGRWRRSQSNFSNNDTLGFSSFFFRPWYNYVIAFYRVGMKLDLNNTLERRIIMKKMFIAAGLALFLCANIAGAEVFTLKSDQIGGQLTIDQVYSGFGCTGKNISPQLSWMN